ARFTPRRRCPSGNRCRRQREKVTQLRRTLAPERPVELRLCLGLAPESHVEPCESGLRQMQLLAAAQTTDSGTFSVLPSLDAEIPASTEYCAKRSAGRNHGSDRSVSHSDHHSRKKYGWCPNSFHGSTPICSSETFREALGIGRFISSAGREVRSCVLSCMPCVRSRRCSHAIHSRREGGSWRTAIPAASPPPRKRAISTPVTSSRSNTVLGPLLSMCACKASRCAACR